MTGARPPGDLGPAFPPITVSAVAAWADVCPAACDALFAAARTLSAPRLATFEHAYSTFATAAVELQDVVTSPGSRRSPERRDGAYRPPADVGELSATAPVRNAPLPDAVRSLALDARRIAVLISMYWAAVAAARASLLTTMQSFCAHLRGTGSDGLGPEQLVVTDYERLLAPGRELLTRPDIRALPLFLITQVGSYPSEPWRVRLRPAGRGHGEIAEEHVRHTRAELRRLHEHVRTDIVARYPGNTRARDANRALKPPDRPPR